MNRNVTPKQLELTAGKSREELLLATAPHIDPASPALKESLAKVDKIEMEEAARAVLGKDAPGADSTKIVQVRGSTVVVSDDDDFNWNNPNEESIVLREQRATAVYRNRFGELIIRQQCWPDDDSFIYVTPENVTAFLEATAKRARET
jgi:hypothetical protein